MKTIISLFIISLLFITVKAENLYQLIQSKKLDYTIAVDDESPHYSSQFIITFQNKNNAAIQCSLDNGTTIEADNEENQNFIVTQDVIVALKPGEKKAYPVYAMCIEQNDAAPGNEDTYKIGGMALEKLVKFSNFINTKKCFEPEAQFLMWDIANGMYTNSKIDDFKIMEDGNIAVFEKIDNQLQEIELQEVAPSEPKPKLMVKGTFSMDLASTKNIHIAMFNENNVLVKELYKNPKTPAGKTNLAYEFNSYEFDEDVYFVKVVMNGKIVMERTIEMSY